MEKILEIQNLTKHCNESLILAILSNDNKHGYQLGLEIEEKSEGQFKFNHGTLYPILHKLEKDGLIKGKWKQESQKRKRKYYNITAKGKEHIQQMIIEWQSFYKHFFSIMGDISK
ncbi:MAG: helix-turn-helix transcriptional regulator [Calditrichaceae bacterium]|jgi:DNA-binding PadR family transcriptional regulator